MILFVKNSNLQETDSCTVHSDLLSSPVLSPETPSTSSSLSSSRKRIHTDHNTWTKKKHQFLDASLKVLQENTSIMEKESQEITFGRNVGQQLQEVPSIRQKIIGQKLISEVLYHAKLGNLTDSSTISLVSQPTQYHIGPLPLTANPVSTNSTDGGIEELLYFEKPN